MANVWAVAAQHTLAFSVGVLVGFVLSNRFRIVRRNGEDVR